MSQREYEDYLSITYENAADVPSSEEPAKQRFLPFADSPIYKTTIKRAKRLTKGEDIKTVYDVLFNIENNEHGFEPGDTIAILPCNDRDEVEQLLSRLNLNSVATLPYTISLLKNTTKKKPAIPSHISIHGSLQELFLRHLDIRSIPKKVFLRCLIKYTTAKKEIETLQLLCSPSSSEEYNKFIISNRSLLHLLSSFPSCQPPVERLLENLPPLQPRPYSISSSPLIKELHITYAVINTDWGSKGVCSGWLESLSTDLEGFSKLNISNDEPKLCDTHLYKTVQFYYRKANNFRLPTDPLQPIIMIGPGTGIAPFVGFLQHRYLLNKEKNIKFGLAWLYYGCRYSNRDFLYKEELEQFLQTSILTELYVGFSRDTSNRVYVQDLIKEHGKSFTNKLVRENSVIYVCGDAKNMAKDVRKTIVSSLVNFEDFSESDAEAFIKKLEQTNRYIQDIWV